MKKEKPIRPTLRSSSCEKMPAITFAFFCLPVLVSGQLYTLDKHDPDTIVNPKIALEKWTLMESRMKSFSEEAVKMIMPQLMETSGSTNISSTCIKNGITLINGVKKMKAWAFKFLDASVKSVDGLMSGTIAAIGNFDECVNNKVINEKSGKHKGQLLFQGMYCRVEARPYLPERSRTIKMIDRLELFQNFSRKDTVMGVMANFSHFMYSRGLVTALCVPSGCSTEDLNHLLQPLGNYIGMVVKAKRCEIKEENKYTTGTIIAITLYAFLGALVLFSTSVNMYFIYIKKEIKGTRTKLLNCFSVITNFEKFIDTSTSSSTFSCLNGIRTLTMFWILLIHTYVVLALDIQSLPEYAEAAIQEFTFQALANAVYSIEAFFVMGGMLLSYNMTKLMRFEKKHFRFFPYLFHRIWRLYPCYIFAILFVWLAPLLGSGPIFHEVTDQVLHSCHRNWWANLLAINNFYDFSNMCFPHAYYIALDLQFYIGSLVVLLPLMKWPRLGISLAVAVIVASMIGSAVQSYLYDLPITQLITPDITDQEKYMKYLSYTPIAHSGPFFIGILIGYLLAVRPTFKIPKGLQVIGWCLTMTISLCVINGSQPWNSGVEPTFTERMFYTSCSRVAFASAIAWVIVSCSTGNGGVANYVLSWKLWIPVGRLTYLAYLVHPNVMILFVANTRSIFHYTHLAVVWQFFGHLVATYLLAFGFTLVLEGPFLSLEKIIFSRQKKELESSSPKNAKGNHNDNDTSLQDHHGIVSILNLKNKDPEGNNGVLNESFVYKL